MVRPITTNQPIAPFAFYVQRSEADPRLYFDPRVKVSRVVVGVEANSDADAEIDWLETKKHGTLPVRHEMSEAWINRFYSPRLRCAVIAIVPGVSDFRDMPVLIHGYIDGHGMSINGSPNKGGSYRRRAMKIRSIFRRAGRRKPSTIQGRYMLSKGASEAIDDEDPPSTDPVDMDWDELAKRIESLPAIFNFQGKPNRLARPVLVKDSIAHDPNAPIHLFTYDGDPEAEYWTFLQALRYLVMIYLPYGGDEQIDPGDLFTTLSSQDAEAWWSMTEAESDALLTGPVNTGWRNMMVRNCHDLSVEGLNLIEALAVFTAHAGMHAGESHTNETQSGEVRVLSHLDFWVQDQKAADVLHLERNASQFTAGGQLRTINDMLSKSNVQSANLRFDTGSTLARTELVAGRKWWIITTELKPLWEIDFRWDDVDEEDADDYRSDAYGDPFVIDTEGEFYKRYSPHGSKFQDLDYAIVGRLWGIDPAGEIDPILFERLTGPYQNYDPFVIPNIADQVRRRRMIDHPEAKKQTGERKKIRLEISLDGGDTWAVTETAFVLHRQLSAIYFKQPNLLTIAREVIEGNGTVDNFYDAYLKHALRFRATFAIELDERLIAIANTLGGSNASPLAGTGTTKMYLNTKTHQQRLIDEISVDPAVVATIDEVDDIDSLDRLAKARLAENSVAKWRGNPVIPWIESSRYPLGTPIQGIVRTPGTGDVISFGGDAKRSSGYPHVVSKVYNAADQTTDLVLRDHSLRKGLKGPF